MPLTQMAILKAAAKEKPFKLSDGGGLHLLVQTNGSKLWRFRYRFAGRENMLTLGAFPTVPLALARQKRDEARRQLAGGEDPGVKRKLDKIAAATAAQNTFGAVAAEYLANMAANGVAESTVSKNRWLLEDLARPLSARPIAEIVPAEILTILKRIEKSGRRETARRLRGVMGSVFRLAVVTLRATDRSDVRAARGAPEAERLLFASLLRSGAVEIAPNKLGLHDLAGRGHRHLIDDNKMFRPGKFGKMLFC
jgi:hypothetical protein